MSYAEKLKSPRRSRDKFKLAIVLVMGFVVLGTTAAGLRQWQRDRGASGGLKAGLKAYNHQQWEEAATNLGRYLAVEQDDVPILLKYAEAQLKIWPLRRNTVQQAIAAYRAVLRIDKDNSEAAVRLAETYLKMRAPGEAELIARRQVETNPDPELRRFLALALAGQRKFYEAATELKNIIEEHPDQVLAYETLGQLTEQSAAGGENFPDQPAHWFDLAVENNPSTALAYMIRAAFHLRNNDAPTAKADLEQAEKQDLSDPAVRLRLAREFINTNDLDKSEKHLAAMQEATPTDPTFWQTWAQLALKSRAQEKMLKIAEAGLKELSCYPWAFMSTAAELFIRGGQLDRASDCISKMRQKNMNPDVVAYLEGLVASEKGQLFEAVKCWRRAVEEAMIPTNTGRRRDPPGQVRLALASALSRFGDTESALAQLRTLVSEKPNFLDGRLALVRLLAQTGNWAETRQHARTATQLAPENLEAALYHLQARIHLLPTRSMDQNSQLWQRIEEDLAMWENATNGAVDVKFLQLQLAMRGGNLTDAEALVAQLKKDHPPQVRIAMAEADLVAAQDKTNEAIRILQQTIREFPEAVEPVKCLASLLAQQGNHKQSEETIKDALARVGQPIALRHLGLLLAESYTLRGRPDKAYRFLQTHTEELPDDIPIKRRLLVCKEVIEDPGRTQQLIEEIKSLEGEDGWQWRYEQARLWTRADDFKDRYPQIISLLQKNLLTNANDQGSRLLLGAAYEQAGELQLAVSTYRDALNRSPDDIRMINPTVAALYKAHEHDEAEEILSRISQEKLLYRPQLQSLRLQSFIRRGELSSASDILQDLLASDPNNQAVRFSLALLQMRQNEFDHAGKLLAELRAQDPNSLPVIGAQIQLNIYQNKPEEALTLCNEVVNNLDNASAHILRAKAHAMLKQTDKAIEDFGRAIAAEPNNAEAWVARSDFYGASGRLIEAVADIQQALFLAPDNIQVQRRAISLFLVRHRRSGRENLSQGRIILDKALESSPDDIELQLLKARYLLLAEGTAPAIENAKQILEKIAADRPETTEAWVLLGEILLSQQHSGKAVDAALRGLAHRPSDKRLLLLKARAEAARSPILAIPTLKELCRTHPNDADIAVYLADTYAKVGETEKAVNLLKEHLAFCKDTGQERKARVGLAVALYQNGNKADARREFDSLLRSAPDDPAPLLAHARLLKDNKLWAQLTQKITEWSHKHPEDSPSGAPRANTLLTIASDLASTQDSRAKEISEGLLRRILDRDPNNLTAMNTLAVLLQMTAHSAESARLYQRILELRSDNVVAINNLAWIMCEEQSNFQQALELTNKGLTMAPQYIDLIDTRGVVYYRLGKLDRAVQDFTTCIKLYPSTAPPAVSSRFHLARAFAKLGQANRAIEHLNQALDLDSRVGGLSAADAAEARNLLEQLRGGS